mgnify:CR=1 FL=1
MITVDKDIPMPPTTHRGPGKQLPSPTRRFPFSTMEIGESFFIPNVNCTYIISRVSSYRPKKFSTRIWTQDGVKGARCWRIE